MKLLIHSEIFQRLHLVHVSKRGYVPTGLGLRNGHVRGKVSIFTGKSRSSLHSSAQDRQPEHFILLTLTCRYRKRLFRTPPIPLLSCLFWLEWRHNERDGVSNHRRLHFLLNRLFRRRSMKTSRLRVTGLCQWNSPVTGEFPAQRASNTENAFIWWRHHVPPSSLPLFPPPTPCYNPISHHTTPPLLSSPSPHHYVLSVSQPLSSLLSYHLSCPCLCLPPW